jgi:hypothetical protein
VTLRTMARLPMLKMPSRHELLPELDVASPYLEKILVRTYDKTIDILNKAINRSAIDRSEKVGAFKRLARFEPPGPDPDGPRLP